jgi:hypothetical protein
MPTNGTAVGPPVRSDPRALAARALRAGRVLTTQHRRNSIVKARHLKAATAALIAASCLTVAGSAGGSTINHAKKKAPRYQYGINTYVTYGCELTSQFDAWATTEIDQYKKLGANSIALAFPLYTDSLTSNNIYTKLVCGSGAGSSYQSPPPAVLAGIVQIAHKAGLSVLIRPLLDEETLFAENPTYWRGLIAPANVNLWFQNYLTTLRPYLQMAQANHVEHFVLETELDSMANLPNWTSAIALSRAVYKGDLQFNYSWDTPEVKSWRTGTSPAIDAYPKIVSGAINQTIPQLLNAWDHLLTTRSYYVLPDISKVTIDEIGISAQVGAYLQPFKVLPAAQHPFNQTVQSRWFSAACAFMKQHHMKGIYYWGPWMGTNQGSMLTAPDPNRPSDIQPAAQQAIKRCFG